MLRVYRTLVRSVFNYGILGYGTLMRHQTNPNFQTRFIKSTFALYYGYFQQPLLRIYNFSAVNLLSRYVEFLHCSGIIKIRVTYKVHHIKLSEQ